MGTGWTVRDRIPVGTRFSARSDRPWGPPSLLQNRYRAFPGGKVRPGRAADHSPPSSAAVMEQYSYTSTQPLGHTGPVTGSLYLFYFRIFLFLDSMLFFFISHTIGPTDLLHPSPVLRFKPFEVFRKFRPTLSSTT